MGVHNTRQTNPRWRTAAILKETVKLPYLCNRLTEFNEIWQGDAHWPLTADQRLKFWLCRFAGWPLTTASPVCRSLAVSCTSAALFIEAIASALAAWLATWAHEAFTTFGQWILWVVLLPHSFRPVFQWRLKQFISGGRQKFFSVVPTLYTKGRHKFL